MRAWRFLAVGLAAAAAWGGVPGAGAQLAGTMSPSFDGWVRDAAGGYTLYFGYVNRSAGEVEVPVGVGNRLEPSPSGRADDGQPTVVPAGAAAACVPRDRAGGVRGYDRLDARTMPAAPRPPRGPSIRCT